MQDSEKNQTSAPTPETQSGPASEAVDEPHLSAEELRAEIGDSETWDEASEDEEG